MKKVHKYLSTNDVKLWMDIFDTLPGEEVDEALARAILYSKVTICFVTKKYLQSESSVKDITFATEMKRKLAFVFIEEIPKEMLKKHADILAASQQMKLGDGKSVMRSLNENFLSFIQKIYVSEEFDF